ncbi:hypothetical protein DL98DRAFT_525599 [Cadophora sp. DSE1049]|nr:hypothetical protein DL98DRAFT_525599 [Cadophora sp. DSE1049]
MAPRDEHQAPKACNNIHVPNVVVLATAWNLIRSSQTSSHCILNTLLTKYGTRLGKTSAKCTSSPSGIVEKTLQGDDKAFETLDIFTRFPNLPLELRRLIFKESIVSRNVMLPIITPTVPVLFHVNREVREIATKVYKHFDRVLKNGQKVPIYFNPALDTFFCFTSTTSTTSPQASLNFTSLVSIPKPLRPLIRRVVIKNDFQYILGYSGLSLVAIPELHVKAKKIMYEFLKREFGALEGVFIVDWVPMLHLYTTHPSIQQLSKSTHRMQRWGLVEQVKKEHPEWKGPKVFRGTLAFV